MNNEVFLMIAGWFFFSCLITASTDDYARWKTIPMRDLPLRGWIYFIDCFCIDAALIAYALTQWGGV